MQGIFSRLSCKCSWFGDYGVGFGPIPEARLGRSKITSTKYNPKQLPTASLLFTKQVNDSGLLRQALGRAPTFMNRDQATKVPGWG